MQTQSSSRGPTHTHSTPPSRARSPALVWTSLGLGGVGFKVGCNRSRVQCFTTDRRSRSLLRKRRRGLSLLGQVKAHPFGPTLPFFPIQSPQWRGGGPGSAVGARGSSKSPWAGLGWGRGRMLPGGSLGRSELKSISEEGREGGRLGGVYTHTHTHTHTHSRPDLAQASLRRGAVSSLLLKLLSVPSPPI